MLDIEMGGADEIDFGGGATHWRRKTMDSHASASVHGFFGELNEQAGSFLSDPGENSCWAQYDRRIADRVDVSLISPPETHLCQIVQA
jgi:hypothetical protein